MNQTISSEVIVCLGQALLPGAKANPVLLSRCAKAVELQRDKGCFIINTGGDTARVGITEARVMTEYMVSVKGIEQNNIVEEIESNSTVENAVFVSRMLKSINGTKGDGSFEGIKTLYLVTSPDHMVRSSYVFKAVLDYYNCGINIIEKPSDDMLSPSEFKQSLMHEKGGIEYHLNNRMKFASPVMGGTRGYNIPLPEKETLSFAHSRITTMLLVVKEEIRKEILLLLL
jgi:hypothetical protein